MFYVFSNGNRVVVTDLEVKSPYGVPVIEFSSIEPDGVLRKGTLPAEASATMNQVGVMEDVEAIYLMALAQRFQEYEGMCGSDNFYGRNRIYGDAQAGLYAQAINIPYRRI